MLVLFGWQYIYLLEERYTTLIAKEGREKTHCIFGSLPSSVDAVICFKSIGSRKEYFTKIASKSLRTYFTGYAPMKPDFFFWAKDMLTKK